MALPQMRGNFNLTTDGINTAVTAVSPGVYNLGHIRTGTFYVDRVGRSDDNLNRRLHDYEGEFESFQFSYCVNAQSAFYAECELWHAYGGSNNPNHPARPAGSVLRCPIQTCPV